MKHISLFLFLLLIACGGKESTQDNKIYFDFPGYVQDQINFHTENKTVLKKRIVSQGKEELKTIESPDLKSELKLLLEQDLNKSSNYNMYIIDSVSSSDSLLVSYQSKGKEIKPNYLRLVSISGVIDNIILESASESSLVSSSIRITYRSDRGYSISKYNTSTVGDNFNFDLYVDFIN